MGFLGIAIICFLGYKFYKKLEPTIKNTNKIIENKVKLQEIELNKKE